MRRVVLALLLTACGGAPQVVDHSAPDRFAKTVVPLTGEFTTDPVQAGQGLKLLVETGDGPNDVYEVNLQSAWDFCQKEPDDCDEGVKRFLAQAFTRVSDAKARRPEALEPRPAEDAPLPAPTPGAPRAEDAPEP